ncbi:helix-hairpin-helix domain-containing protein [Neofamilia massiliensis]|uniref:helix-hairpin-helix domain-containing protein n=1 Tax=Neofamilia massiliensis TaxID=1673724 RepID=UPI0006BB7702|nr:helix-hairpin-helix domain-containing protein [Neofamilia massiliensis]
MFKDKGKSLLIILFYLLLFLAFFLIKNKNQSESKLTNQLSLSQNLEENPIVEENNQSSESENEDIYIHISGNVNYPGLVKMKAGQRLFDAIELAGGMTEEADIDQINLSLILNDQDKIYIPAKGEIANFIQEPATTLVNINTASKEELTSLSGIGDKTAEKIINYRQKTPFSKKEDLMNVPGIGENKYKEIEDNITI